MALGFERAGFDVVCSVDIFKAAVETYRANFGERILDIDLSEDADLPKTDVVIGGPPCQGFSSAGVRRHGDKRNSLVSSYVDIILKNRPKAFIFENVEGFLTAEHGERVFDLLAPLVDAGYNIHLRKINAAEYGVPQHRKRVIGIGGLGWEPDFPAATHRPFGAPGSFSKHQDLPDTPSLADALRGLAPPSLDAPGQPQGHFFKPLSGIDQARAVLLGQGQTMRDLPEELQHDSYKRRANRRVQDGIATERRGGAPTGVRRLRFDEPSKAITGGARSEFLHPTEHRNLTIRECARVQTFPDEFVFKGPLADQIQLIGNAVPPHLAEVIATSLLEQLQRLNGHATKRGPGRLLSFMPTDSLGYSPALKSITERVKETFQLRPGQQATTEHAKEPFQLQPSQKTTAERVKEAFQFQPGQQTSLFPSLTPPMAKKSPKRESPLSMTQRTIFYDAKAAGAKLSMGLDDAQCAYLLLLIADDLGIRQSLSTPGPETLEPFFGDADPAHLQIGGFDAELLFAELLTLVQDADTYFHCLATLHKRRLKYARILQFQAIPTIRQVGPRGLLQYGSVSSQALGAFLFWRKWLFDIDNRAGQETGYIFEPIVARCIGGQPYAASKSPVRRSADSTKGRQVDCLLGDKAYEIKLRITVAASGQGRWGQEKEFPVDCQNSGYTPILLVFDDTQADKLDELSDIFRQCGGSVMTGDAAWAHLEEMAGATISTFLEKYVRGPLEDLLNAAPERDSLPDMLVQQANGAIHIRIGEEELVIPRPVPENLLEVDETEDETED